MCKSCPHPIEAHGDRAVWPACEGTHSDPGPLFTVVDGTEQDYAFIRWAPKSRTDACECKGFTSG